MPFYDRDIEVDTGPPIGAHRFCERLKASDALIVASPEYNASMPAAIKNLLDWVSRFRPQPFNGKQDFVAPLNQRQDFVDFALHGGTQWAELVRQARAVDHVEAAGDVFAHAFALVHGPDAEFGEEHFRRFLSI